MLLTSRRRFFSFVGALFGALSSALAFQRSRSEVCDHCFGRKTLPVEWPWGETTLEPCYACGPVSQDVDLCTRWNKWNNAEILRRVEQRMEDAQNHLTRRHIELKYGAEA